MEGRRRERSRSREERGRSGGGGPCPAPPRDDRRDQQRSRNRSRERDRRPSGDRQLSCERSRSLGRLASAAKSHPLPAPQQAAAAEPPPAAAISLHNLLMLFASFEDVAVLIEVERLLKEHNRRHPDTPQLSALKGLYVRYKHHTYHLGAVTRFFLDDDGQPLLMVQGHMENVPYISLPAVSVSTHNPLVEPGWSAGGLDELAALQEYLQAARKTLTLQQAAEAVVRRRAALHWYDKYNGEENLADFLPRLIAEMTDAEEVQRVMRRIELAPKPSPRQRERERRRESPQRQRQAEERPESRQSRGQHLPPPPPQQQQQQSLGQAAAAPPAAAALVEPLAGAAVAAVGSGELPPHMAALQPPLLAPQGAAGGDLPLPPHLMHVAHHQPQPMYSVAQQQQQQPGGLSAVTGPAAGAPSHGIGGAAAARPEQQQAGPVPMHRVAPTNVGASRGTQDKQGLHAAREAALAAKAGSSAPKEHQRSSEQRPAERKPSGRTLKEQQRPAERRSAGGTTKDQQRPAERRSAGGTTKDQQRPAERRSAGGTTKDQQRPAERRSAGGTTKEQQRPAERRSAGGTTKEQQRPAERRSAGGTTKEQQRPASGSGNAQRATAAAGDSKRKRPPIEWQPQESLPGDQPLQPHELLPGKAAAATQAAAAPAGPKAKQQKVAGSSAGEPKSKPAAAPKKFSVTVQGLNTPPRGSPTPSEEGELPVVNPLPALPGRSRLAVEGSQRGPPPLAAGAHAAEEPIFPPGFGDHVAMHGFQPALEPPQGFRAASYSVAPGGGGTLTVSAALRPHAAQDPYASGGLQPAAVAAPAGGSLAGRFDSLYAAVHQREGDPAPQAPMVFSVRQQQQQQPVFPAAQQPVFLAGPNGGLPAHSRYDAAAEAAAYGQQLGAAQLGAAQQQQQQQQLQQQQLQQQQYLQYSPVAASLAAAAGYVSSGFAAADLPMAASPRPREGERLLSSRRSGSGMDSGGRRQVQMEGSSGRGGSSGSGGGSAPFWDPLYNWECEALRMMQAKPSGMLVSELHDKLPLPPCWNQAFPAMFSYLFRRKQLFSVNHQKGQNTRATGMVLPAKGARTFLGFKHDLLQALADQRPRTSVQALLRAAPPPHNLRPDLRDELERDPLAFVQKYLGGEVSVGRSQDRPGSWRLELRSFPATAQAGAARIQPPFKPVCLHWSDGKPCIKGDRCHFCHALPRKFDK